MKKIITTLITITLSCAMVNTMHAKRSARSSSIPAQQAQIQKSAPSTIDKKTSADTRKLQNSMKALTTANTPQEKAVVKKKISQAAAELLEDLEKSHEERSTLSEVITGYSQEQRDKAEAKLRQLYPIKEKLDKKIEYLKALWRVNTKDDLPIKGKEAIYESLKEKFSQLVPLSEKIDSIVYDQERIAGIRWSNAFKSLMYAAALGVDYTLFGGSATGIAAINAGFSLASIYGAGSALLELDKKLEFARWVYGVAKNTLNELLADPDATPEEITKAEKDVAQKQAEQKKLEQQVKQQQQKQPAKAQK